MYDVKSSRGKAAAGAYIGASNHERDFADGIGLGCRARP